jgi:F0F1-type ATP synthase assembly protein I
MSSSGPSPQPDRDEQNAQNEKSALRRRQGMAYQGAFEAVFAILIAGGLGYGVDAYLDSSPIGLLVGFAIGFAAFVMRLVRLGRVLNEADEAPPPRPGAQ